MGRGGGRWVMLWYDRYGVGQAGRCRVAAGPPQPVAGARGACRGALRPGRRWPPGRGDHLLRVLRHVRVDPARLRGVRVRVGQSRSRGLGAALHHPEPAPPRRPVAAPRPRHRRDHRVRRSARHRLVLGGRPTLIDPPNLATTRIPRRPPCPGPRRPARPGRARAAVDHLTRRGVRNHQPWPAGWSPPSARIPARPGGCWPPSDSWPDSR